MEPKLKIVRSLTQEEMKAHYFLDQCPNCGEELHLKVEESDVINYSGKCDSCGLVTSYDISLEGFEFLSGHLYEY